MAFNQELANEICERLASGENLKTICESDHLPSEWLTYKWLRENDEFANQYAQARAKWADTQIEKIISIADDKDIKPDDKRVMIDTRKWAMGKLNGKYSDKLKHVGGDEGDSPIEVNVSGIEWSIVGPEAQGG